MRSGLGPAQGPAGTVAMVWGSMNPYQAQLLDGVREGLSGSGHTLVVCGGDPVAARVPDVLCDLLTSGRCVGVISTVLSNPHATTALVSLLARPQAPPTVFVSQEPPGFSTVTTDNAAGIEELVRHLVDEQGSRRIALVRGISHHGDAVDRERAFLAALERRGLRVEPGLLLEGEFERDTAYRETAALLRRRRDLDTIVAMNDQSALGVLDALSDAGVRVPEQVAVAGFDGDLEVASLRADLTTVDQDLVGQGRTAAHLLLRIMAGAPTERSRHVPRLRAAGSSLRSAVARDDRPVEPADRPRPDESPAPSRAESGTDADDVTTAARTVRRQLALLDASLALHRAFGVCRTVPDVMVALSRALPRMGVERCAVVLERVPGDEGAVPQRVLFYDGPAGLVDVEPSPEVLAPEMILGPATSGDAERPLFVQPMHDAEGDVGHVVFTQGRPDRYVAEVLRLDVGHAVTAVARLQELARWAATLESLVDQRTRALHLEVDQRLRIEGELRRANDELRRVVRLDGLTQIANRTALDEALVEQWAEHAEHGRWLGLLLLDVDHFKAYNDRYGHLAGDRALRRVAQVIARVARGDHDLAARYGGEEFALVLPRTDLTGVVSVARRVLESLDDVALEHDSSPVADHLTVSIGAVAMMPQTALPSSTLVAAADQALYRAKAGGRHRIETLG